MVIIAKEEAVVKEIRDIVEWRGGWVANIHGDQYHVGIPDLIICYKGFFIAVECKSIAGRARAAQKVQISKIIKAQGRTVVARHKDDVVELLDEIDRYAA